MEFSNEDVDLKILTKINGNFERHIHNIRSLNLECFELNWVRSVLKFVQNNKIALGYKFAAIEDIVIKCI